MRPALLAWRRTAAESTELALDGLRSHPGRAALAIGGIVIGVVTVVLVAAILVNVRNQVALLFRDLGTENVFAFHLTGDPYVTPAENEARRLPLKVEFAEQIARAGRAIREVGVQIIVPTATLDQVLTARADGNESDTVLVEATSPNFFDVVGAEFDAGRPFTDLENREAARVAVVGSSLARALWGSGAVVGRVVALGGEPYTVVGQLAPRRGGFFGENRQDNVLAIPEREARRRFGPPERVVLYVRAQPGQRDAAFRETEAALRRLRGLAAEADNDFTLSTADQIIGTFDRLSAQIGLVTVGLAAVCLFIGAIGIANVMFISVTERTREIGLRLAVGARRANVRWQFLIEAAVLSGIGGAAGVAVALAIGLLLRLVVAGFSAVAPLWAVGAGVAASVAVGVLAGYWPARRAARLDPVEALRHE
jgi:putative ABC transport system permease protein